MGKLVFVFLLIFLTSFHISLAQITKEEKELLSWFDSRIGVENTRLLNGVEYIEKHRTLNENNSFFLSGAKLTGSVLYDDEWFHGLQLKYNVYEDLIIAEVTSNLGINVLQLRKEHIKRFEFPNYKFINVNAPGYTRDGINEILLENSWFTLLKKHALKLTTRTNQSIKYFEFEPRRAKYGYSYNKNYYEHNSRKQLISHFPEFKELIAVFYRENKKLYNTQRDTFMVNLFQEITANLTKGVTPAN